jgi:hypothetical protein
VKSTFNFRFKSTFPCPPIIEKRFLATKWSANWQQVSLSFRSELGAEEEYGVESLPTSLSCMAEPPPCPPKEARLAVVTSWEADRRIRLEEEEEEEEDSVGPPASARTSSEESGCTWVLIATGECLFISVAPCPCGGSALCESSVRLSVDGSVVGDEMSGASRILSSSSGIEPSVSRDKTPLRERVTSYRRRFKERSGAALFVEVGPATHRVWRQMGGQAQSKAK